MDARIIEELLEKYWNCETTQGEEDTLRMFFCEGDVPSHLERYRELFAYQNEEAAPSLGSDFDARIMDMIRAEEAPKVKKAVRMPLMRRMIGIAAVAALAAGMWVAYDAASPGRYGNMTADTFGTPEEALAEMEQIFSFIGAKVDKGSDLVDRSIEKTAPIREIVSDMMEVRSK